MSARTAETAKPPSSPVKNILRIIDSYYSSTVSPTHDELQSLAVALWDINSFPHGTDDYPYLDEAYLKFTHLLEQSWKMDKNLQEPYQRLNGCFRELLKLRDRNRWSSAEIRRIQEQVHDIESKYVHDGKFGPAESTAMSQAVIFALLHNLHRLTKWMIDSNEPVSEPIRPFEVKLQEINSRIDKLMKQPPDQVNLDHLHDIQHELDDIDSKRQNGYFVPDDWKGSQDERGIPRGQAECRFLLEDAYDKIYRIQTQDESNPSYFDAENPSKMKEYIRSEGDSLGSKISGAYSRLNEILREKLHFGDRMQPKFREWHDELAEIVTGLRKARIRTVHAKSRGQDLPQSVQDKMIEESKNVEKLRLRLVDCEAQIKANAQAIAPNGRDLLNSMRDEAYALLMEIDRASQ